MLMNVRCSVLRQNNNILNIFFILISGNAPGTITPGDPLNNIPDEVNPNANAFWTGLNSLNQGEIPVWVGDGSSTFTDFLPTEPTPTSFCGTYNQVTTKDNIHMDATDCLADNPAQKLRYICEVSDECTALFMSRFPTSYFHHPDHHHGHVHYNAGGYLPPMQGNNLKLNN
jgi:hypothetical protein